MFAAPRRFPELLRERRAFTTDELLRALQPLFRQVQETHEAGLVAPLEGVESLQTEDGCVYFEAAAARPPRLAEGRLRSVERLASPRALDFVAHRARTLDVDAGDEDEEDLLVAGPQAAGHPVYLAGYRSWEHALGHHDALTDHYVLGLVLASLACGLDLGEAQEVELFARSRSSLFALNPHLNAVVAKNIVRLTELDRHRRAQDLGAVIRSLEAWRDQDVPLELDLSRIPGFHEADLGSRRKMVLARLRERLFEISRRNRLLYYRPTLGSLNLTFASVPLLFDPKNIRPEQLFTWQPEVERLLAEGTAISLSRYLRFEDAPYVPSVLDKLVSQARRDTAEFGFSQLRLVLCFLRWHDLKNEPSERIHSPLLLLPVELAKRKGVRDSYVMRATSREAEVNPVLRHHLKQLYGIDLPHTIDLSETTIQTFHDVLSAQIQGSEPGVVLERIDRPQVEMIHARARRRLDQYRRRLRVGGPSLKSFQDMDYSYARDNYQPLGLQLFTCVVRPSPAPLRDVLRERPREVRMVAESADPPPDEKRKTIAAFREGGDGANPYAWEFDLCNLTLGDFNYRKMSLVRDYNSLLDTDLGSPTFDAVFSFAPRPAGPPASGDGGLERRYPVVPCDPTQLRALEAAASGESYIIQGPPGTGKSQTITNLIADLVAAGKRLLFVCEKRAAIDVVFHRLQQRGLHQLVCLIHDSQADKREFVMDLKATYERLLQGAEGDGRPDPAAARASCLSALADQSRPLARFDEAMRGTPDEAALPLRQLIVRAIEGRGRRPDLAPVEAEALPPYRLWVEHADGLGRLETSLREAGTPVYARHPLHTLAPAVAARDRPRASIEEDLRGVAALAERVAAACREAGLALGDGDTLGLAAQWLGAAERLEPLAHRGLLGVLDPASTPSRDLARRLKERQKKAQALEKAAKATHAWRQKLDRADLAAALEQVREAGSGPFRFFKSGYWRLRRTMRERYDFGQHAVRPGWTKVLEALEREYAAADALEEADAEAREAYGAAEGLEAFGASVEAMRAMVRALPLSASGQPLDVLAPRAVAGLLGAADVMRRLIDVAGGLLGDPAEWTLAGLRAECERLRSALDRLPDWMPCLAEAAALPAPLSIALRTLPLELPALEAAMASRTLEDVWRRDREVARLGPPEREAHATRLRQLHGRYLEVNAEVVLDRNRRRFLDRVAQASLPSVRLSAEQEAFKKKYNAGRRELEHEFGKTTRYKSVRGLLAGPAGEVILDMKPVWLMSPLSVSDTLPLDTRIFDVVVFDEASQVPLEEAVPVLFRADQVIVSGDQMQLPPTNFFSATRGDDDLLLDADDERVRVESELDSNSFLTHAARTLPSTMLGWHYRSRSESLISFSNAAFYDGHLLTVPERQVLGAGRGEIRVAAPEEGEARAADLLERPVSFHRVVDGVYEGRRNQREASYVAHLVRGLLAAPGRPTIGIVAFSEAQQSAIEAAIERVAQADAAFQARLEEEYEREEDGQFAGLLVKNLENIQGDERDVVILSVCYGYGPDGRMLMNFGPINQGGGEKRLNVAFSRAKRHMAVVSSIDHADVKNVYNDGANSLRRYLQYAAAVSAGDERTAGAVLRALRGPAAAAWPGPPRDLVVEELAAALGEDGIVAERGVGHSRFRCDLALRLPGDQAHRLAVFVDAGGYYEETSVLERAILKPELLQAFGWSVAHVLARDWYDDRDGVVRRLERRLRGQEEPAPAPEPVPPPLVEAASTMPAIAAAPVAEATPPAAETIPPVTRPPAAVPLSALAPGQVRYFEFTGGSSRKFWHVAVDGAELVVSFGRLGTDGQVKRKPFPSADLARREAERLVREKLAKGYQEVAAP